MNREALDSQAAPIKELSDEKERELRVLEEQERLQDDAADMERRVVERCREFSDSLDDLDGWGKRAVLSAFGVQVRASKDDLLITLRVSPECTTIGRTLALLRECSHRCRWA